MARQMDFAEVPVTLAPEDGAIRFVERFGCSKLIFKPAPERVFTVFAITKRVVQFVVKLPAYYIGVAGVMFSQCGGNFLRKISVYLT